MQYLRATAYTSNDQLTVVVACDDLAVSPDEYKNHMKDVPGPAFVAFDVFEHDGDLTSAIIEARERWEDSTQDEMNQAVSYHWNGEMLAHARAVLMNPAPAPLSVEQVKDVLEQLAKHPNYAGQQVLCFVLDDNDNMTEITMQNGEVSWIKKGEG